MFGKPSAELKKFDKVTLWADAFNENTAITDTIDNMIFFMTDLLGLVFLLCDYKE